MKTNQSSSPATETLNVPNCYLWTAQDGNGNSLQALVPFGRDATATDFLPDSQSVHEMENTRQIIYSLTIRHLLGIV